MLAERVRHVATDAVRCLFPDLYTEFLHAELSKLAFDAAGKRWQVLPAGPCVLAKLRGTYRWHVVVKCPREDDMSAVLARLIRSRKADREVNAAVDVDCYDLL